MSRTSEVATQLDHMLRLAPLGLPMELCSNSPAVIAAAEAALGHWRALPEGLRSAGPPLRLDLLVRGEAAAAGPPFALGQQAYGPTMVAGGGANLLTARADLGYGLAFVTPELAADGPGLRAAVIEPLTMFLAARRDRRPLRAAAVLRNGRALLLAGPPGGDTSALCYACMRRGFQLLAADVVYLSCSPGLRIWGGARTLSLPPAALSRFAELADRPTALRRGDDGRLALDIDDGALCHAGPLSVCLLEGGPGRASQIEPAPVAAALAALDDAQDLALGPLPAALADGGSYRLRVGSDLESAVALLAHLTAEA